MCVFLNLLNLSLSLSIKGIQVSAFARMLRLCLVIGVAAPVLMLLLCCAVLCCAVLLCCCAILCCAVLLLCCCCVVLLCCVMLCCAILCCSSCCCVTNPLFTPQRPQLQTGASRWYRFHIIMISNWKTSIELPQNISESRYYQIYNV